MTRSDLLDESEGIPTAWPTAECARHNVTAQPARHPAETEVCRVAAQARQNCRSALAITLPIVHHSVRVDVDGDIAPLPVVIRCLGLNAGVAFFAALSVISSVAITAAPSSTGSDRVAGPIFALFAAGIVVVLLRMEVRLSEEGVTLRRVRTRFVPWQQLGQPVIVRGMFFDAVRVHIANRRMSFWMPDGGVGGVTSLYEGLPPDDDNRSMRLVRALDHYRQTKQLDAPELPFGARKITPDRASVASMLLKRRAMCARGLPLFKTKGTRPRADVKAGSSDS